MRQLEGDEDERLRKEIALVIACCIVGFVIMNVLLVFVIGHQDPKLKAKGAQHVNSIVAHFVAVGIAHAVIRCFDFYVICSILNGSGVVYPSIRWGLCAWLMKIPVFMFWFLFTSRLSYSYRESASDLAFILMLCSNVTSFTSMEIFSNVQFDLGIAVARLWFSVVCHWVIVIIATAGFRILIDTEIYLTKRNCESLQNNTDHHRTTSCDGIELSSPPETLAHSSGLEVVTKDNDVDEESSPRRVLISEDVDWSRAPSPDPQASDSAEVKNAINARRKRTKSMGNAMRLAAKSTHDLDALRSRQTMRSSVSSAVTWAWGNSSADLRTFAIAPAEFSKDWVKELLGINSETSAMAVGFLVKEAIEAQITGRCSNFMDSTDESISQGEAMMTLIWTSIFIVITLVMRRLEVPALKYLSTRNLEYVHHVLSATVGWLCFSVLHMSISISITQRSCENLAVAFTLTILLAALVIVSSKLEGSWQFEYLEATVDDLLSSLAMTAGFCWESSWSFAIHSLCLEAGFSKSEQLVESLVCLTSVALILPGWRFYVLPYALNCAATEVADDVNEALLTSPLSPTSSQNARWW